MGNGEGEKGLGNIRGLSLQDDGRIALAQQAFKAEDEAAPSSKVARYGAVTVDGIKNLPSGVGAAIWHDITHPLDTAKMLAGSAAFGAVLKTAMPEGGPTGVIAGLAIGGYMMYKASEPVMDAYSKAGEAKTMKDMDAAGLQLGNAAGMFLVDTGISVVGYKIGAGATNKWLTSESMDGFAQAKHNFWSGADSKVSPILEKIGIGSGADGVSRAGSVGIASRIKFEGNKAELLNSERAQPLGVLKGEANPGETMSVSVMLKSKATDFLMDRHLNRITAGRQAYLSDAQFAAKFGADPLAVEAVNKFASENGLAITDQNLATGRVVLKGTVQQMQDAFSVKLHNYETTEGMTFRGRQGTISVPTELATQVEGVYGLDTRPQFRTHYVKLDDLLMQGEQPKGLVPHEDGMQPHAAKLRPFTVEEAFKAYNAPVELDGKGINTAFVSLGGTLPEGWQAYLKSKGIDPATVKVINTTEGPLVPDPRGANGENALDLFIHKEALPKGTVTMVSGENSDHGFITAIERAAFPKAGEGQNTSVSISWGAPEDQWTAQGIRGMELAAKKASLKGVTITAAAGDDGAMDGSHSGKAQTDFPASSRWITGVGGTTLTVDAAGNWAGERTWSGSGATGGGRSLKVGRPDYQSGLEMPPNMSGSKFDGRGVPDIAFSADPRTGWKIFTDEGITAIGGTSASAPAAAVIAAKIFQSTGKPVGFWNPALYEFGKNNPGVYRDVITGNNDGYPATKGWDATTGWGSINVEAMLNALKQSPNNVRSLFPVIISSSNQPGDRKTGS